MRGVWCWVCGVWVLGARCMDVYGCVWYVLWSGVVRLRLRLGWHLRLLLRSRLGVRLCLRLRLRLCVCAVCGV